MGLNYSCSRIGGYEIYAKSNEVDSQEPKNDLTTNVAWAIYHDSVLGFQLEYPKGWEIAPVEVVFEKGSGIGIFDTSGYGSGGILIGGVSTVRTQLDASRATNAIKNSVTNGLDARIIENVNMGKYKIDGRETGTFVIAYQNPIKNMLGPVFDANVLGIHPSDTTTSSIDMYTEDEIVSRIIITKYNGQIFSFGFNAVLGDFEKYYDIMNHVFKSIKFDE